MILTGDCTKIMPMLEPEKYDCCVTSPPYLWVRDYGIQPTDWPEITYTPMAIPGLPSITVPAWTGCLGLEPTPHMFVAHSVHVFRMVWRLLRKDGTLWLNYGDTYAKAGISGMGDPTIGTRNLGGMKAIAKSIPPGLKPKDLIGIPWQVAFALQADGWYLRMDNIWAKPNPMPESVTDRTTKSHEYYFLLSKSERYYYDHEAIKEYMADSSITRLSQDVEKQQGSVRANGGAKTNGTMKAVGKAYSFKRKVNEGDIPGQPKQHREDREDVEYSGSRNKRSVFWVPTAQFSEAHYAVMPDKLAETGVLAGSRVGGTVFDPFGGAGTTYKVALENNRNCTIIEIGPQNVEIAKRRTAVIQTRLNL